MKRHHLMLLMICVSTFTSTVVAQKTTAADSTTIFTNKLVIFKNRGLYGLMQVDTPHKMLVPAKYPSYKIHDFTRSSGFYIVELHKMKVEAIYFSSEGKEISSAAFKALADYNSSHISGSSVSDETAAPMVVPAPGLPRPSSFDTLIFERVELDPSFYGEGKNEVTFIKDEMLKTIDSLKLKEKGTVSIRVIVEKKGTISYPKVLRSSSDKLTRLSMAILNKMNEWRPGMQNGYAVRTYFRLDFVW